MLIIGVKRCIECKTLPFCMNFTEKIIQTFKFLFLQIGQEKTSRREVVCLTSYFIYFIITDHANLKKCVYIHVHVMIIGCMSSHCSPPRYSALQIVKNDCAQYLVYNHQCKYVNVITCTFKNFYISELVGNYVF